MNEVGLQVSSVGNHEFDEGVAELIRMQNGGCHPVDGCQDGEGFDGAKFSYLAANTIDNETGKPILPAIEVRKIKGVPVGFVGLTLEGTAGIVNPAGGSQGNASPTPGVSNCKNFSGPIVPIVAGLNPKFGLVVSGHTHRFYSCTLPNAGGTSVVTSAGTNGQLITDIDYALNRNTGRFASITAKNVIVENGVPDGNGGWKRDANNVFLKSPDTIDAKAKKIADKYRAAVAPIATKVVGKITSDITRNTRPSGESPLGDVIADAQLVRTWGDGAQIALMNPGGIRAGFTYKYGASAPLGSRVGDMALNGTPIDPAASYRVTTNDFLANGGDGFGNLTGGTNRTTAPGFDIDALVAYLGAGAPVAPGLADRITLLP